MPVSAIMYISPIWSPVSGFPASVSKDELADLEWQVDADIYDESSRTAVGFTANPPSGSGHDTARKEQAAQERRWLLSRQKRQTKRRSMQRLKRQQR